MVILMVTIPYAIVITSRTIVLRMNVSLPCDSGPDIIRLMRRESDKRPKRISATEASRSFSKVLDEVESGRRYLIHRRGHDVCVMAPPGFAGRRASECLALLRGRTPVVLDGGFEADLLSILAQEPAEDRPRWGS